MSANDECSFLAPGSLDEDTFEEGGGCVTPRVSAFKKMVYKISNRLDRSNVESIVFLYELPQDLNESTSLHVLNSLYKRSVFSPRNVQPLKELLQNIHRGDLVSDVVEEYLTRIGKYNSMPVPKSPKLYTTRSRHYSVDHLTIAEETTTRGYGARVPHFQIPQLQGVPPVCTISLPDSHEVCPLPANVYGAPSDQTRKIPNSPRPRSNSWETLNASRPERQSSHGSFLTVDPHHIRSGPPSSISSLSPFSSTNSLIDDPPSFVASSPIPVPPNGNRSDSRHNDSISGRSSRSNTPYTPSPSPSFPNSQEDYTLHTSSAPTSHPLHHVNTYPLFQQYDSRQTQTPVGAIQIPLQPLLMGHGPNTGASPPVHPTMAPMPYQLQISVVPSTAPSFPNSQENTLRTSSVPNSHLFQHAPSTAPLHRAGFAQMLSAAKSDSRLTEASPQGLCQFCSQNLLQQSENGTQHQPPRPSSRPDTPDLLEGACGPQPQRVTTELSSSAEFKVAAGDTRLPPPITQPSSCDSYTRGRQQPQSGKPSRKLRPPWKKSTTPRGVSWRLKRSELNEAICEHKKDKFYSSPHRLAVEFGYGKANPRLALKLYPYGLETDREKNATLEISIEVPRKCPRLHSSVKADISLSIWDCKENTLLSNKQQLSVSLSMRTVLVTDFISHDRLKHSRSEYVEIKAIVHIPTSSGLTK